TSPGGIFPLSRRLHALLVVDTKVYMHGGNTTATVSTDTYANDLWVLDTQNWQWNSVGTSPSGRALHTLLYRDGLLLSISGFEFETSKQKAAQNAYLMIYDTQANSWSSQFGTIGESFFQKHGVAVIAGSVSGFIAVLVIASVIARLCRRRRPRTRSSVPTVPAPTMGLGRKKTKPFLATSSAAAVSRVSEDDEYSGAADHSSSSRAAARLGGMSPPRKEYGFGPGIGGIGSDTQIDLSNMSHSGNPMYNYNTNANTNTNTNYQYQGSQPYFQPQQQYNQFAPVGQQQRVPLMSANALDHQQTEYEPYTDDDNNINNDVGLSRQEPMRSGPDSRSSTRSMSGNGGSNGSMPANSMSMPANSMSMPANNMPVLIDMSMPGNGMTARPANMSMSATNVPQPIDTMMMPSNNISSGNGSHHDQGMHSPPSNYVPTGVL
ncbi:hypothetical protein BGW38_007214, partial [Lunasporangiospora selenospora]